MYRRRREHRSAKVRLGMLLAICLAVLLLGCLALVIRRPQAPFVPRPTPNAADTLAECSQLIAGLEPFSGSETSIEAWEDAEALRSFLDSYPAAMEKWRTALGQACVPIVDDTLGIASPTLLDGISEFRKATYLPRIAGRLAQLENRPFDAARHYAELSNMGTQYSQHGVWVHVLTGLAMQRLGLEQIDALLDSLDDESKSQIRDLLVSGQSPRPDFDAVAARERVLVDNQYGALRSAYSRFLTRNMTDDYVSKNEEAVADIERLRTAILEKLE